MLLSEEKKLILRGIYLNVTRGTLKSLTLYLERKMR